MPDRDDGVGVPVGRVVFVGWGISVGLAVLDGRAVLAGFGVSADTSMVTAVLVNSAVTKLINDNQPSCSGLPGNSNFRLYVWRCQKEMLHQQK